jgi:predicted NAD/FAD-dependent oxidoreductase/deoxyribodipyrimidine photolyase
MNIQDLLAALPPFLAARSRALTSASVPAQGGVLYWMHHAARDHDNPALDSARLLADRLGRPLLVYQGLAGVHPDNNDRQHHFIAEGALAVQAALAEQGVRHVFHLPTDPAAPSPLRMLVAQAAVVIVEDWPVPPFPRWTAALLQYAAGPAIAVDAAGLLPFSATRKAPDRAFAFREKHGAALLAAARAGYPALPQPRVERWDALPFESFAGDAVALAERIASTAIDHDVAPVAHSRGGSAAGYARWEVFRQRGLAGYAKLRNDAAVTWPRGVSRISPWLHQGHISPFRIAREAAQTGGPGADKFLDELLIWRELARHWCFHTPDPNALTALPAWARETLTHTRAARQAQGVDPALLEAGEGIHPLYDLCQQSLLRHGELHNNLRMSWGKVIAERAPTPETALSTLLRLNNRYALDGNDPNSWGGLLWCLGLFDRPFQPPHPVLGTLRPRSLDEHASRLDLDGYRAIVSRPAVPRVLDIAVIGAGVAGCAAARQLQRAGHRVRLYDKGRGAGGRLSTRREGGGQFDYGAMRFHVDQPHAAVEVARWQALGLVEPLAPGLLQPRRGASALVKAMQAGLSVSFGTRVTSISAGAARLRLALEQADGSAAHVEADRVILAVPAPQALDLWPESGATADALARIVYAPCQTLMLWFAAAVPDYRPAADDPVFSAMSGQGAHRVLQASAAWSSAWLEAEPSAVAEALLAALTERVGPLPPVLWQRAHRWRYATVATPLTKPLLTSMDGRVLACGDGFGGSGVGAAWCSGVAAAARLIGAEHAFGD